MPKVVFDENEILSEARARTGLIDFGEDLFREPLSVLLKSLREEAPLNEMGCATLRERIVDSLEMRLKTQDWIHRHPEILEEEIESPIVVVGLVDAVEVFTLNPQVLILVAHQHVINLLAL